MKNLTKQIQNQFDKMCQTGKLFRVKISGSQIWDLYLNSFKPENNIIFRDNNSSEHNCNYCKNFIRRYGNIVAINSDGNLESIFSNLSEDLGEYTDSIKAINELIISFEIENVFFETYKELNEKLNYESCNKTQDAYKLGIKENSKKYTKEEEKEFGHVNADGSYKVDFDKIYSFNHFCINLPKQFVKFGSESLEQITAHYRDKYSVFKRAMEEIPLDTLNLVKDLINQGSLLDGTTHLHSINEIIEVIELLGYDIAYYGNTLDSWYWQQTYSMEERTAKFKNTLIGVLCAELAEGMELNKACQNWNKRVDPVNYHKAIAPITKKQIEEAKKFVEENGYEESFNRRLATIEDINTSEILHRNEGDGSIKPISIFDSVKSTSTQHKKAEFDKLEEVSIDKFMKDILPSCTSIEAYLENRMEGNLCVLTKALESTSKQIFKWDNNYSWTFNGNLAGKSQIKEAVKSRGGKTEADIRISLAFPNTEDDYDLHVLDSNGNHIYYTSVRQSHSSSGVLDLDAQGVDGHQPSEKRVENVVFTNKSLLRNGDIKIWVENYSGRGIHSSFNLEIEIEGEITTLQSETSNRNKMDVGRIQYKDGNCEIHPDADMSLKESKFISKELWELETNNFHKVNLVCLSPNHWGEIKVGNLHYMFMLDKCKAEGQVRGFHNENLIPELIKHRKVMEVLGTTNMIEPTDKHLAGLGFNSTVKDELIVKLQGTHKRMLKIKF